MYVRIFYYILLVLNSLFCVFPVFTFLYDILDIFLWSYLWFITLSSIVFNLLPNTSIEILTCYYIFSFQKFYLILFQICLVMFYSLFPSVICELVVSFFHVVSIYKLNKSTSEICPGLFLLSIVYTGFHLCCLISLCVYLSFNCFAGYCP